MAANVEAAYYRDTFRGFCLISEYEFEPEVQYVINKWATSIQERDKGQLRKLDQSLKETKRWLERKAEVRERFRDDFGKAENYETAFEESWSKGLRAFKSDRFISSPCLNEVVGTLVLSVLTRSRHPKPTAESLDAEIIKQISNGLHMTPAAIARSDLVAVKKSLHVKEARSLAWSTLSMMGTPTDEYFIRVRDSIALESFCQSSGAYFSVYSPRRWQLSAAVDDLRPSQAHSFAWKARAEKDLVWYHLSSTNGLVVSALLEHVTPGHMDYFYGTFQPSPVTPGDPFLNYREPSYQSMILRGSDPLKFTVVVLPCLMLSTVGKQRNARQKFENIRRGLIPNHDFNECTFNLERTLDEAYHPGLDRKALEKRNNDQIVSHSGETFERYNTNKGVSKDTPILMVPQLWLWRIGKVLISAHSMTREFDMLEKIGPKSAREPEMQEEDETKPAEKLKPLRLETDLDLQMGIFIARHIESFGKSYDCDGVQHLPALDLFENRVVGLLLEVGEYVGTGQSSNVEFARERYFTHIISDLRSELAMIYYFLEQQEEILEELLHDRLKNGTIAATADQALHPPSSPLPTEDASPPSVVRKRMISIAGSKQSSSASANVQEPSSPKTEQAHPSTKIPQLPLPSKKETPSPVPRDWFKDQSVSTWLRVEKAGRTLKKYKQRVRKIDADAERIEKAIQDLLNLKRTHASIQDAHSSLILSTAVIGFTVVTIVFAPLAFLTALFALKIEGFGRLQIIGQDGTYDSGKLSGIFVSAELLTLVLTFFAIKLAFWYTKRWDQEVSAMENLRKLWRDVRYTFNREQKSKDEADNKSGSSIDTYTVPLDRASAATGRTSTSSDIKFVATERNEASKSNSTQSWIASKRRAVHRKRNPSPGSEA